MSDGLPRLYSDLASWWSLLSAPEDYAEEAQFYSQTLMSYCATPPQTVLELGSGGGNNAYHMKAHFNLTLVDLSPGMLAVSRALNPELEHIQGDMRTLRLGRQFDAVFIHDAIMYMTNEADLKRAMETAHLHCKDGGAVLLAPDCTRETFRPMTEHGGHDRGERGLRYLEWVWDPDPHDSTYLVDFACLLREGKGVIRCEYDHHTFGLFGRQDWLRLLADVGFEAHHVPFPHKQEAWGREVFVGVKK